MQKTKYLKSISYNNIYLTVQIFMTILKKIIRFLSIEN